MPTVTILDGGDLEPGFCRLMNHDALDYVEYGAWDQNAQTFYPLGEIGPGEKSCIIKLSQRLQLRCRIVREVQDDIEELRQELNGVANGHGHDIRFDRQGGFINRWVLYEEEWLRHVREARRLDRDEKDRWTIWLRKEQAVEARERREREKWTCQICGHCGAVLSPPFHCSCQHYPYMGRGWVDEHPDDDLMAIGSLEDAVRCYEETVNP